MSSMQAEVFEAFRSIDVPEDKALKAAAVLGKTTDDLGARFNKVDVDLATIKGEQVLVRWMLSFMLAMQVAILFKLFTH